MKLARFWTRAEETVGDISITARGWSDQSIELAREKAREIARRVAQRLNTGAQATQYLYGDRPLPEPVIRELPRAVVTRNAYGSLVLNTDRMMFVDIDKKETAKSGGLLSSLFSKPAAPAADPAIDAMQSVVSRHNLSARVYETSAGYRLIVTNRPIESASAESDALLKEFHSDPLYIRLCKLQESFRARLTPKPWRCGFHKPPVDFPYEDEAAFQKWLRTYESKCSQFATCRFVTSFGFETDPEFTDLIQYHDSETKAATALPLA
jgi:hypothetical protein